MRLMAIALGARPDIVSLLGRRSYRVSEGGLINDRVVRKSRDDLAVSTKSVMLRACFRAYNREPHGKTSKRSWLQECQRNQTHTLLYSLLQRSLPRHGSSAAYGLYIKFGMACNTM